MRNVFLIALCLTLSACGVKPGGVSAPEGSAETSFPKTYPDTRTDPIPARMRTR